MKMYYIYHASGIDRFTEVECQPRTLVEFVEANSVEEAYQKSQNLNGGFWNRFSPCRSTSVGDAIKDQEGFHLVLRNGFKCMQVFETNTTMVCLD